MEAGAVTRRNDVALTVKRVARLLAAGHPGKHLDSGSADSVRGLHLVVANPKNASWQLRYQLGGRVRWMGLGSARDVPLAKARERAKDARLKLVDKVDPLEQRRKERAAQTAAALRMITFAEAAHAFHEQHEAGWKNRKHAAQVLQTLKTYAFPTLGQLPVDTIDTPLVLKVLRPIWTEKTETASRVRGRIESVLGWATVSGYRSGDNPARWKGHLEEALPKRGAVAKVKHHAALDYRDIPAFMAVLRTRDGMAAQALAFTVLTAARTGEVIGARWDEVDLDDGIWTIPAGRMKAGKEHRVPLSELALEILHAAYREESNPFVFIGGQGGAALSSKAMMAVLQRMGHVGERAVTTHGFRSSFRDWAAEQTGFPHEVVEQALAHSISNKVERAYRRGDLFAKRAKLMQVWARYCISPPTSRDGERNGDVKNGGVVVPLQGRGRR
jgi:integrase